MVPWQLRTRGKPTVRFAHPLCFADYLSNAPRIVTKSGTTTTRNIVATKQINTYSPVVNSTRSIFGLRRDMTFYPVHQRRCYWLLCDERLRRLTPTVTTAGVGSSTLACVGFTEKSFD